MFHGFIHKRFFLSDKETRLIVAVENAVILFSISFIDERYEHFSFIYFNVEKSFKTSWVSNKFLGNVGVFFHHSLYTFCHIIYFQF